MQLNVLAPSPASVYTHACVHTLFLVGRSDVSEMGLEEIASWCVPLLLLAYCTDGMGCGHALKGFAWAPPALALPQQSFFLGSVIFV